MLSEADIMFKAVEKYQKLIDIYGIPCIYKNFVS